MFETYKLNESGIAEVKAFKSYLADAINDALELMPEGREKSIFLTKTEEAVFFGTKAIASKAGNFNEVTNY